MNLFQLPPFEITEKLVLRYYTDSIEVFEMGENRNVTIFYRKEGGSGVGEVVGCSRAFHSKLVVDGSVVDRLP